MVRIGPRTCRQPPRPPRQQTILHHQSIPVETNIEFSRNSLVSMTPAIPQESSRPKPIPAFYCCYLLRSTQRRDCMYIGSTPNPARRLKQHNGTAIGGAKRTKSQGLRPWHMVAIVEGFPSRTGALQFEWSWQNVHMSRHIDIVESDALDRRRKQGPTKSNSKKHGLSKSLPKILGHLHQLLRSSYFAAWPLAVRFLSPDVYTQWQCWTDRVDGLLPDNMQVKLDFHTQGTSIFDHSLPANDMTHIDATYNGIKDHLEKALFLLDDSDIVLCEVCTKQLSMQSDAIVVCSQRNCRAASHLMCLSQLFLSQENSSQLVPTSGDCPACHGENTWADLAKELTFRLRGGDAINHLLRTKRTRKAKTGGNKKSRAGDDMENTDGDGNEDLLLCQDGTAADDDFDETWIDSVDIGSDAESVQRATAEPKGKIKPRVEIVIEDSEAED